MFRRVLLLGLALYAFESRAEGLTPDRLGLVYNPDVPATAREPQYYGVKRPTPPGDLVGLSVADSPVINRTELSGLRTQVLAVLPSNVQSLLVILSKPD